MKIVNIIGGLGNKMFQYAFAIALKSEFPEENIKINTLCFNGYSLHNGFELNRIFKIDLEHATIKDLVRTAYPWINYRFWQIGKKLLPRRKGMAWDYDYYGKFNYEAIRNKAYFDGYWQAPEFFEKHKKNITEAFKFPDFTEDENIKLLNFIKDGKTAFVHVRRGDYLKNKIYGGISTDAYYHRSIAILKEKGYQKIIVFSNDILWCKTNLKEDFIGCDVVYCNWNKGSSSFRDLQLMGQCNAAVIANSSFSWWGAWLGNLDLIICPERWTNIPGHRENIYPETWYKVSID